MSVMSRGVRTNQLRFDDSEVTLEIPGEGRIEHPDVPLFTRMDIAQYKMRKVLVDNGSSGNIILESTLQQLGLDSMALGCVTTSLLGFGGSKVLPKGTITLDVSLGEMPQRVTHKIKFLVVDSALEY